MSEEQYSLNNLRDIVVPDPPSLWPPAPGVWILVGIITAVLLFIFWRLYVSRKQNAYRRAGLELLGQVHTCRDILVLLKRVALAVFPRQQVASLYGQEWVNFLNSTCCRCNFSKTGITEFEKQATQELVKTAQVWIKYHSILSDGNSNPVPLSCRDHEKTGETL